MPQNKEPVKKQKSRERLARNRGYAKVSRERQRAYTQAMQDRIVQIEAENAALRAEVERELHDNERLKEALAIYSYDCVWV